MTTLDLTSGRHFMLELTQDQRECEAVRAVFGCWNDVIHQLRCSAHELRAMGEERQCDALLADAESMARRARLHIGYVLRRHTAKHEQPQVDGVDGTQAQDGAP